MRKDFLIISLLLGIILFVATVYFVDADINDFIEKWPLTIVAMGMIWLLASLPLSMIYCMFLNIDPLEKWNKEEPETESYRSYTSSSYTSSKPKTKPKDDDDDDDDDDGFARSVAIGYLTDSTLMGGALGGNYLGGFIGSTMRD